MTITEANWLDFGNIIINEIIGSTGLFIVLGLIVLNYYGVKESLPIQVNMALSLLFIGLVISYTYNALIWMVGLFVVGMIIYGLYPKIFKR